MSYLPIAINDVALRPVAPESPQKPRVPLAEEHELGFRIAATLFRLSRPQGWKTPPIVQVTTNNKISVSGQALLKGYPSEALNMGTVIAIPPIDSANAIIQRDDILSLVGFVGEVGIAQDPSIGINFRYREPNTTNIILTPAAIENSRRYRAFWCLLLSPNLVTASDVLGLTSLEQYGDRRIAIVNQLDTGFQLAPGITLWAADPNLVNQMTYVVLPDSIEVLPICSIRRIQNFQDDGITIGYGGEEPFTQDRIIPLASSQKKDELSTRVWRRLVSEICAGVPGVGKTNKHAILNLSAGLAAGNPGRAGIAANSPNNSYCIGNDQRVSFTNQRVLQKTGVAVVTANNNNSGNAVASVGLNTNAPLGSFFSADPSDHKIYATDGTEQSSLGSFSNLGGTGSLQWNAGTNSSIQPGSTVFFVPGIVYPSGSGFSLPFTNAEMAWHTNGAAISAANVRYGMSNDLDDSGFVLPANQESFIIIFDTSRSAILCIYQLVTVQADVKGCITIPSQERGCFAFIEGVAGRIDAPVHTGLTANQSYRSLIYYPPRNNETWQIKVVYPEYQGIGNTETDFLDGAEIISQPIQIVHSQGGGLSVHACNSQLNGSCISMHLPSLPSPSVKDYDFDTPIYLPGETYQGPITFRGDIAILSAANLGNPSPGQIINFVPVSGSMDKSISGRLSVNGKLLGYRSPVLASRLPFQSVLAFAARNGEVLRLVVCTHNCNGQSGEDIVLASDMNTAIDIFNL